MDRSAAGQVSRERRGQARDRAGPYRQLLFLSYVHVREGAFDQGQPPPKMSGYALWAHLKREAHVHPSATGNVRNPPLSCHTNSIDIPHRRPSSARSLGVGGLHGDHSREARRPRQRRSGPSRPSHEPPHSGFRLKGIRQRSRRCRSLRFPREPPDLQTPLDPLGCSDPQCPTCWTHAHASQMNFSFAQRERERRDNEVQRLREGRTTAVHPLGPRPPLRRGTQACLLAPLLR